MAADMALGARRVATSSVVLLAENLIKLLIVVAVSFWIVRHLGPGQFGILNFASTVMAILLSLAGLGMDTPVILRLTQTDRPGALMGTVLAVRAAAGLLIFSVAVAVAYALRRDDEVAFTVMVVVSLSIFASTPTVLDFWFKSRTAASAPATARIAATLGSACAKVACLLLGLGVVAFAWTVAFEAFLTGLFLTFAYRWAAKRQHAAPLSIDLQLLPPLARESWGYLLSGMAIVLYMKIDVVMLGYMSTNTETGIYSLAQKLSEVLYVVPVVLIDSAFPSLAKKFSVDGIDGGRHGQMLFDLALGGSMVATIVALLIAKPVIHAVFGPAYDDAVEIFHIHAWSALAIGMNVARHNWFAAVRLQRYAPMVTGIGLAVNVALNLLLIPRYGAAGAAGATVVSYFLSAYATSFCFPALRNIARMQTRSLWPWHRLYCDLKLLLANRRTEPN